MTLKFIEIGWWEKTTCIAGIQSIYMVERSEGKCDSVVKMDDDDSESCLFVAVNSHWLDKSLEEHYQKLAIEDVCPANDMHSI